MVLNGYNYHEKPFKKVALNNPLFKQKRTSKGIYSINRRKSKEIIRDKKS